MFEATVNLEGCWTCVVSKSAWAESTGGAHDHAGKAGEGAKASLQGISDVVRPALHESPVMDDAISQFSWSLPVNSPGWGGEGKNALYKSRDCCSSPQESLRHRHLGPGAILFPLCLLRPAAASCQGRGRTSKTTGQREQLRLRQDRDARPR